MKKIRFSNSFWLIVAIFCMLYRNFYLKVYFYPHHEILMFLYQYFTYQIFFFCIMKVVGSTMSQKMQISIGFLKETRTYLIAFIILYAVFILLIERNILNLVLILSPIRFFIYVLFILVGLFVGINDKNEKGG